VFSFFYIFFIFYFLFFIYKYLTCGKVRSIREIGRIGWECSRNFVFIGSQQHCDCESPSLLELYTYVFRIATCLAFNNPRITGIDPNYSVLLGEAPDNCGTTNGVLGHSKSKTLLAVEITVPIVVFVVVVGVAIVVLLPR
jgi:hypothetical protein